ncbi:hypothetical protein CR513_53001, partial [Mucuna pruriens]
MSMVSGNLGGVPRTARNLKCLRKNIHMTNYEGQFIPKEASLSRLPAFNGEDYAYWGDRMKMCIKSTQ